MIKHICIPSLFLPITNILQNPKFWLIVDKQLVQVYKICMYSVAKARIIAPYRFANGVNKFFFLFLYIDFLKMLALRISTQKFYLKEGSN